LLIFGCAPPPQHVTHTMSRYEIQMASHEQPKKDSIPDSTYYTEYLNHQNAVPKETVTINTPDYTPSITFSWGFYGYSPYWSIYDPYWYNPYWYGYPYYYGWYYPYYGWYGWYGGYGYGYHHDNIRYVPRPPHPYNRGNVHQQGTNSRYNQGVKSNYRDNPAYQRQGQPGQRPNPTYQRQGNPGNPGYQRQGQRPNPGYQRQGQPSPRYQNYTPGYNRSRPNQYFNPNHQFSPSRMSPSNSNGGYRGSPSNSGGGYRGGSSGSGGGYRGGSSGGGTHSGGGHR